MKLNLNFLLDDQVRQLSSGQVTNNKDFNLKASYLAPLKGGIYDADIFGSCHGNRCNCGTVRRVNVTCPTCLSKALPEPERYTRYGHIELPIYYLCFVQFKAFKQFIAQFGINVSEKNFGLEYLDFIQWDVEISEDGDPRLTYTQEVTDKEKISYQGLLTCMEQHFPDKVMDLNRLINKTILVLPVVSRPAAWVTVAGVKRFKIHDSSTVYSAILDVIEEYSEVVARTETPLELARWEAVFRRFINNCISELGSLLASSKANPARSGYGQRIADSGRAAIIPDPSLRLDQVGLPRSLAYEAFKAEFVKHVAHEDNVSKRYAKLLIEQAEDDMISRFDEWCTDRLVIINRNPSLHEYNMQALRVQLTDDIVIGLPLMIVAPFNADFDGDTMSFYVVPEEHAYETEQLMSPKNLTIYKKSLEPLYVPRHEVLQGLNIATQKPELSEDNDGEPWEVADLAEMLDEDTEIWSNELVKIGDRVDSFAAFALEDILGYDYRELTDGKPIDGKNVTEIVMSLNSDPERIEKLHQLQSFALRTLQEGVTTIDPSQLYSDVGAERLDEMRELNVDTTIDQKEKTMRIEEMYSEYLEEVEASLPGNLVSMVRGAGAVKMSAILKIITPHMYVMPDGSIKITENSLGRGLSVDDWYTHAIDNRMIQDAKVGLVPTSGYLTRQLVFIAYTFTIGPDDETNRGILIPANRAEGRTNLAGERLGYTDSTELVRVRSIVSKTSTDSFVGLDLVSTLSGHKRGGNFGVSAITSLTEGLTQAGLSLKHGGRMFSLDDWNKLRAPMTGYIDRSRSDDTDRIVFIGSDGTEFIYPRPGSWVGITSESDKQSFIKGQLMGMAYKVNPPNIKLDRVIKFIRAKGGSIKKRHEKTQIHISDCFAMRDGEITYKVVDGRIYAYIDGLEHTLGDTLAYIPEGTKVRVGDRISAGLVNFNKVLSIVEELDYQYLIFRSQFITLVNKMNEELIEFLFFLIILDIATDDMNATLSGVQRVAREGPGGFFGKMSFEGAKTQLKNLTLNNIEDQLITDDIMTRVGLPALPLFLNHENHNKLT